MTEPSEYEYWMIKARSHEQLEDWLNSSASLDWEPLHYAISGDSPLSMFHFVMMRRNSVLLETKAQAIRDKLAAADYEDPEERAAAEMWLGNIEAESHTEDDWTP